MKKLVLLLCSLIATISLHAQTVKFLNEKPVQGQVVQFVYQPTGGNLSKFENIKCEAKGILNRADRVNLPVKFTKVVDGYQGEFTASDSIHLVMLSFVSDGNKDENPNGYFTKFYKGGTATPMGIFLEGYLHAGLGNRIAKMKIDHQKASSAYQVAFTADEKLKEKYLDEELKSQYILNKKKGAELVRETIDKYNQLGNSEANLSRIAAMYAIMEDKTSADSVNSIIKVAYPKGSVALNAQLENLRALKGADNRERKLNEILKDFALDLNNKQDAAKVSPVFMGLGTAFMSEKNYEKVEFYIDKIESKTMRAVLYNSFSWKGEKVPENLPFFVRASEKAVDLISSAMQDQEPAIYYNSKEEYMRVLNNNYIMYKDTYSTILAALNRNEEALNAIADAAKRDNFSSSEMNGRYVGLLIKNGKLDEAQASAERFIRDGHVDESLKNNLKSLYKGKSSFDVYYSNLENEAIALQKKKLISKMIAVPAPKFKLMNLKGQHVDLASLKGKTVIVDYWATWCGPCILSFPGMQKAIEKYRDDPNVAFVFINTWQREENRDKLIKDWMSANKKYTFNVLLDEMKTDGSGDFETVDNYKVTALPTKFVIDANGVTRFKTIGSPESVDAIVRELDMMIQLAKGTK